MTEYTYSKTSLDGIYTIKRNPLSDDRGSLTRMFCQSSLRPIMKKKNYRSNKL